MSCNEVIKGRDHIKDCLLQVYGVNVKIPEVIDVQALAVAAGWKLKNTSFLALNLVTTGGHLPGQLFLADGHWALQWPRLMKEYQLHLLDCIWSIGQVFTILLSLLVRNFFPDPDIWCSLLELNQEDTFRYLTSIINFSLREIDAVNVEGETREDLIHCLNMEFEDDLASRLAQLTKLIPIYRLFLYSDY